MVLLLSMSMVISCFDSSPLCNDLAYEPPLPTSLPRLFWDHRSLITRGHNRATNDSCIAQILTIKIQIYFSPLQGSESPVPW
ncbi:hypothetical protein F5882DRAFT_408725 [Hyaloscypha sp. PMI_1271]|nr:hypothetical protein F5882DRAFT_408725 [Hyaloscypha sp. PMI_1271]